MASVWATRLPSLPLPITTTWSPAPDPDLLLHLQGGRGRLREDRHLVGHGRRHLVQVRDRQDQVLRERAVAFDDPEHGAALAMRRPAGPAGRALAAGGVDLAHHPLADPALGARGRLDGPDELVARDPRVRVIAPHQLEVGVAHAGLEDAHQGFAGRRRGRRAVVPQTEPPVLEPQRAHGAM